MENTIFIKGDKVDLCVLEENYVEGNYKNWLNDSEVCNGNSHFRFPISKMDLKNYIGSLNASVLVLAIIEKTSKIHIGNVALQNIDSINRSAEFAIVLGEKSIWGKGYGKEAALLLITHGFNNLNLNRIYCGTFSTNHGMIGIAKHLNMRNEGIRKEAVFKFGKYYDVVEFGILQSEFEGRD